MVSFFIVLSSSILFSVVNSQILSQIFGENSNLGGIINNFASGIKRGIGLNDEDVIGDLQRVSSQSEWSGKARDFCRRFPQHQKCRNGQLPDFNDLPQIISSVIYEAGRLLPQVPNINIQDPLTGLLPELVGFIHNLQEQFGQIREQDRMEIARSCRNFNCAQQAVKNVETKKQIFQKITEFHNEKGLSSEKINLQFDRTLQVKQSLLKRANLKGVVAAADDGIFDKDILLSEHQSNFLLNELGEASQGSRRRAPRSGIFFQHNETTPIKKWDIWKPIQYTFDDSLEESEKQDVRNALHAISIKTCILFRYNANPQGNHLKYYKVDSSTFCGLSYIGKMDPANPIYLSFQCGDNRGVAIHETMHALGVNHQHLRIDRDKFIKIDWSNINPQHYDAFAISDAKLYTSYGTNYAYDSIMHYDAYLAAINPSKPTMIPLKNPSQNTKKLGQRKTLSWPDIKLLKKMYCRIGCDDKNVHCGTWALNGFCRQAKTQKWMHENCMASCDKC
ncbi:unnamed protein product [Caenorhabditis angaria]|uniref:Metalloendopeptidase n=1 Tax=Caenorhabditis angaria TaxID=860376 RepID=A0A9P1IZU5_9PELO|nr:unnamed protein product [Caenorhabditis angaria]